MHLPSPRGARQGRGAASNHHSSLCWHCTCQGALAASHLCRELQRILPHPGLLLPLPPAGEGHGKRLRVCISWSLCYLSPLVTLALCRYSGLCRYSWASALFAAVSRGEGGHRAGHWHFLMSQMHLWQSALRTSMLVSGSLHLSAHNSPEMMHHFPFSCFPRSQVASHLGYILWSHFGI